MTNRPRAGRLTKTDRVGETHRLRAQGLTHREIAERLDISVSTVANDLRSSPAEATTGEPDGDGGSLLGPVRAVLRAARNRLP
jgi:DNA invertase Pin-like site-specific DNA recombinase